MSPRTSAPSSGAGSERSGAADTASVCVGGGGGGGGVSSVTVRVTGRLFAGRPAELTVTTALWVPGARPAGSMVTVAVVGVVPAAVVTLTHGASVETATGTGRAPRDVDRISGRWGGGTTVRP